MSSATNLIDSQASTGETTSSSSSSGLHKLSSGQAASLYWILGEITKIRTELMDLYKEIATQEIEAQNAAVLASSASRVQAGSARQKGTQMRALTSAVSGGLTGAMVAGTWRMNKGNREEAMAHDVVVNDHGDLLGHFKNPKAEATDREIGNIGHPTVEGKTRAEVRAEKFLAGEWGREKGSDYANATGTARDEHVATDKTALVRLKNTLPAEEFTKLEQSLVDKLKELRTQANSIQSKIEGIKHNFELGEKILSGLANGGIGTFGQAEAEKDEAQKDANNSVAQAVAQSASSVIEAAKQESSKCLELILALNNAIAQAARASAGAA